MQSRNVFVWYVNINSKIKSNKRQSKIEKANKINANSLNKRNSKHADKMNNGKIGNNENNKFYAILAL